MMSWLEDSWLVMVERVWCGAGEVAGVCQETGGRRSGRDSCLELQGWDVLEEHEEEEVPCQVMTVLLEEEEHRYHWVQTTRVCHQ